MGPMILSRIMPIYLQLFFELMKIRNSIRNGTKFYYNYGKKKYRTEFEKKNFEDRNGNFETSAVVKNRAK